MAELYTTMDGLLTEDPILISIDQRQRAEAEQARAEQVAAGMDASGRGVQGQLNQAVPPEATNVPGMTPEEVFSRADEHMGAPGSGLAQQSYQGQQLAQHGIRYVPGQAGVEAGFRNAARQGRLERDPELAAQQDRLFQAGADLAGREAEERMRLNELEAQRHQAEMLMRDEWIREKETEKASIDSMVNQQRLELDQAMARHRELMERGAGPQAIWGTSEGKFATIAGALALALNVDDPQKFQMIGNMVNGQMDRLIQEQKEEIARSGAEVDNMYARLQKEYGSQQQADAAMKMMMLDQSEAKAEQLMLDNANPQIEMNYQRLVQNIQQQKLALDEEWHKLSQGNLTERYQEGRRATRGRHVYDPKLHMEAQKHQATLAETQAKTQKDLQAIRQEASGSEELAKYRPQIEHLNNIARSMELNTELGRAAGVQVDPATGTAVRVSDEGVPGFGITGFVADLPGGQMLLSEEGAEVDRLTQESLAAFTKTMSGAQSSDQEAARLRRAKGYGGDDAQLRASIERDARVLHREMAAAMAALPAHVRQRYSQQLAEMQGRPLDVEQLGVGGTPNPLARVPGIEPVKF